MRVLFVSSGNMIATHLAYLLKKEGNDVKLFVDDRDRRENFKGLLQRINDWRKELPWVGKTGLIVFDDTGYGEVQDTLRKEGYSVFGGCLAGDHLEKNREAAQRIFAECGIKIVPIQECYGVDEAIDFIKKNPDAWVIKQNDDASKSINYIPQFANGSDAIAMLESYRSSLKGPNIRITLQQKIIGIEIATSRFFNGTDWVGPIELNIEHKKLFPDDLGPATSEMGTLAWYDTNENNPLFKATLGRLKPYLQKIEYRGVIDINCIVNENGAYPLEATPRFGSPIVYLQSEMHKTEWGSLLKAVADNKPYSFETRKGFGIVTLVAVPPFPYTKKLPAISPKGLPIYFDKSMNDRDMSHIHFEGVMATEKAGGELEYKIADYQGYVLYVTSVSADIRRARKKIRALIDKIYIPKMFYRNDIGLGFLKRGKRQLELWGYL